MGICKDAHLFFHLVANPVDVKIIKQLLAGLCLIGNKLSIFLWSISLLGLCSSCNTAKKAFYHPEEQAWQQYPLPDSLPMQHVLFLAGGAAEGRAGGETPVLSLLKSQLEAAGKESTVVFMGDNVPAFNRNSPKALKRAENLLSAQLGILKNHEGKALFIPGEKDWNHGKPDGRDALLWQEQFIESRLGDKEAFLPGNACGTPEKIKVSEDIRLLFADSQWWLQDWESIKDLHLDCEVTDRYAFLEEIKSDLKKYDKERVVLFMHHPMYSNGNHGGSFSWKHHLFPLTFWKKNAWLPLPGIGTLAVLARQLGASRQDASNSKYLRLREELLKIAIQRPANHSLIVAGAHDPSLQYFEAEKGRLQFIVSGSAGRAGYARAGKNARFVHARQGFAKLYFYQNQEVWLEFIAPGKTPGAQQVVFRKKLFGAKPNAYEETEKITPATLPDSALVAASTVYGAGRLQKIALGSGYRQAWQTPVRAPVFNLDKEFHHLAPVEQGGGMTSKNLQLEAPDGKRYVLRSIGKSVRQGVPQNMQNTVVENVVQDIKSGLHPYSAFVVAPLAEAAGVYHTNPRLYYLPRQHRLGEYNEHFADELYLFEERPAGNWSDLASFGNSPDIINYLTLLQKIYKSPKHRVDEKWALKSRLFDQFIHDSDRHDDQWRWAAFPQGDSLTIYRPIPRDRDQAFFNPRGLVAFFTSRRFMPMQQRSFRGKIYDVPGLAAQGTVFDRSFIQSLDHDEWMEVAHELKASLTDAALESAFQAWSPEIYRLHAPQILKTLRQRRDRIPIHAEKLYRFRAQYADVTGTEKPDCFEVKRAPEGTTEVSVFSLENGEKTGQPYYHRIFKKSETREIRLFGMDGDDVFVVSGEAQKAIRVRAIGGNGDDRIEDKSHTGGLSKKTFAYDTPEGMNISGKVRDLRENHLKIHEYNRGEFQYSRYFPLFTFVKTVDDGWLFGGGVKLTRYRFRKRPYGIQHHIFARFSANTNARNLQYTGDYTRIIGKLDFNPDLRFDRPVIFNFFGLGNDTKDDAASSRFNWVRLEKMTISPLLKKTWYNGRNFTRFGPFYERVEVETSQGRITDTDLFTPDMLTEKNFIGATLQHHFEAVDNNAIPRSGLKIHLGTSFRRNLTDRSSYGLLEGSLTAYLTTGSRVEFTIATRLGAATLTSNNFLFYHSNNLGGNTYLRGFRNNRFGGKSMIFHNTDLRLKLFYWSNPAVPFELGIMGGFDYGRVRANEDGSGGRFHTSISPGLWLTPFKMVALCAYYSLLNGEEDDSYTVRLGFYF